MFAKPRWFLGVAVAATVLLSGCTGKPKVEGCWAKDTKDVILDLTRQSAVEEIADELKEKQQPFDANTKAWVEKNMTITLKDFYVTDANATGALSCGASADLVFVKDDKTKLVGSAKSFAFNVYPSENGQQMFSIPTVLPIKMMVRNADSPQKVAAAETTQLDPQSAQPDNAQQPQQQAQAVDASASQ